MKTLRRQISESRKDSEFNARFEEERKLLELSMKVYGAREESGLSQVEVAKRAHVTQQQLSKIENGNNCNMLTFLKVCNALSLEFDFINISTVS